MKQKPNFIYIFSVNCRSNCGSDHYALESKIICPLYNNDNAQSKYINGKEETKIKLNLFEIIKYCIKELFLEVIGIQA